MNWHLTAGNIPMNFVMTPNQELGFRFAAVCGNRCKRLDRDIWHGCILG
jgi:hypothetical protein